MFLADIPLKESQKVYAPATARSAAMMLSRMTLFELCSIFAVPYVSAMLVVGIDQKPIEGSGLHYGNDQVAASVS